MQCIEDEVLETIGGSFQGFAANFLGSLVGHVLTVYALLSAQDPPARNDSAASTPTWFTPAIPRMQAAGGGGGGGGREDDDGDDNCGPPSGGPGRTQCPPPP